MGLLEQAKKQSRDLYVIHFSDASHKKNLHVNDFSKHNHFNIKEILEFANYFEGGGTYFEPPLDLAQELIGSDGKWKKADIVFITDGESAVRDSWLSKFLKWRDKNKVNVVSILISEGGYYSDTTLKEFSTKIHNVRSLAGDDALDTALSTIMSV